MQVFFAKKSIKFWQSVFLMSLEVFPPIISVFWSLRYFVVSFCLAARSSIVPEKSVIIIKLLPDHWAKLLLEDILSHSLLMADLIGKIMSEVTLSHITRGKPKHKLSEGFGVNASIHLFLPQTIIFPDPEDNNPCVSFCISACPLHVFLLEEETH